jgi:hypothetical protein
MTAQVRGGQPTSETADTVVLQVSVGRLRTQLPGDLEADARAAASDERHLQSRRIRNNTLDTAAPPLQKQVPSRMQPTVAGDEA